MACKLEGQLAKKESKDLDLQKELFDILKPWAYGLWNKKIQESRKHVLENPFGLLSEVKKEKQFSNPRGHWPRGSNN